MCRRDQPAGRAIGVSTAKRSDARKPLFLRTAELAGMFSSIGFKGTVREAG